MTKYLNSTAAILVFSMMTHTAQAQDAAVCDLNTPEFPCAIDGITFDAQEELTDALANGSVEGVDSTLPVAEDVIDEAPVEDVAEEAPAEETPMEEVAAEEPTEETIEAAPAEEVMEEATAEETPIEEAPAAEVAEEAPAEEAAEETPAEEIAEEAPAEEAVEDAPAEEMTQEAPAEEISEETPAEESPSATPAEDAPADEMVDVEEAQTEVTDPEALADETPTAPEDTVEEAAPSAAASEDGQAGEIEEETVSDEDVRSSSQDFDNSVTAAPAATSDDDDGLSNFERALLLGLGAVAIGSILDNGDEVVSNSGDRIVLQQPDGTFRVLKDDDVLLRQPGSNVRVERFDDGSSRTFVTQADGNEIVTIRSAEGRVLRRALILPDGSQVELFDDTQTETSVDVSQLPPVAPERQDTSMGATEEELRAALQAGLNADLDRTFSLRQVRVIKEVRELAPLVELDTITFQTGSAAIQPDQARDLARLGTAIKDIVTERPGEVFLIEGHTDAVGSASSNLALSDRRAETVALALTEYFDVPAANLVTQGYGETVLKIRTLDSEVANRRASVRNITQLLR